MPISETLLKKIILAAIFLTFLLLLFKNPFSQRNLISNLEPFPDTIHYLNPPLTFLEGKGFIIERESRTIRPAVPFLYSGSLIPGFILNQDVRFFYFTNVILAFLGLIFFYKFLAKVISNNYIVLLILFLYITNYFIFWYPNLPMSENLLLPLYIVGLYLLVSKLTPKSAFFAGVIGISFYATKYASVSLAGIYLLICGLKILLVLASEIRILDLKSFLKKPKNLSKNKEIFLPMGTFILGSSMCLLLFFLVDSYIRGNNIFLQLLEHARPLASKGSAVSPSQPSGWFDFGYFKDHILLYLNALTGKPMNFLWDNTPLVPKYIASLSLMGIFLSLFVKKYRFLSISFIFLILIPVIAISPFYTTDARYIYHSIPTLLAGFGLFLILVYDFLFRNKLRKVFYIILAFIFIFYAATNFQRIKYQIALNLRHSETPWHYMSVKHFNNYFNEFSNTQDKPMLITAMQPFYIDFFSNSNYQLLPLSSGQEFIHRAETVWGPDDYSDLSKLYQKYLEEGKNLYVTNAALGNEGYLRIHFNSIRENFNLQEINKGCFDTCNIYKVTLKN